MKVEPSIIAIDKLTKIANKLLGFNNVRCILEFGSRYGEDSIELATKYPHATIYAFECNPNTLPKCKLNIRTHKNIYLTEKAVSDVDGEVSFFKIDPQKTKTTWADGNQGASSLLQASGKYPVENYVQEQVKVQSITLSTFISQHELTSIDILWMDIQGAELLALKGLYADISKVKIIQLEVEFFEIYKDQPLFDEVNAFLISKGFNLLCFSHYGEYSGDAIFVNEKIISGKKITKYKKLLAAKPARNSYLKRLLKRLIFKLKSFLN